MCVFFNNFPSFDFTFFTLIIHNIHVKFHVKLILFTIRFINLYFVYNLKFKKIKFSHFINEIVIDFLLKVEGHKVIQFVQKYVQNIKLLIK